MPSWARKQWWEVWVIGVHDVPSIGRRIDRYRRSKKTADRVADELRATKMYLQVWTVEVNRL